MKEKVIKFLEFLFPKGNYRYYVMYLSSMLVLSVMLMTMVIVMDIMIGGIYVSTEGFVAHITSSFPPRSDFAMEIVNKLYNLSGYILLIFAVHTALSLIADFVVRPLLWLIRTLIGIYYSFFWSPIW
jgi:hypothetical protein